MVGGRTCGGDIKNGTRDSVFERNPARCGAAHNSRYSERRHARLLASVEIIELLVFGRLPAGTAPEHNSSPVSRVFFCQREPSGLRRLPRRNDGKLRKPVQQHLVLLIKMTRSAKVAR